MLNERDLTHPLAGGVEVHLDEIARRLVAQHGIDMTVLCAGYDGCREDETREGVRYVRFGDRGFSYYAMLPGRARAELATGQYDIVVENLCKLLFFSSFYLPKIPKLALVHHLFGLSAFRQVAAPIATYVAGTEALLPLVYRRWPFVVVSPSTRDDLTRRGLARDRILVIPNGLDHEKYSRGTEGPDSDLVVFVGRIEFYKGVDVLLDAWARVLEERPEARLVLVGAGTAEEEMRRRASSGKLGASVSFEGFVSEETKIGWMRRATVLVQPSHKEGWGLTVLEANACGTPVVATDVPGLRDSVRAGETGLLVAKGDAPGLAAGIVKVLGDPDLRARLAHGAGEWVERFRWDEVTAAFAEVVRAVAEGRDLPRVRDFMASSVEAGA